jgi:ELWxxDGT repeat protein
MLKMTLTKRPAACAAICCLSLLSAYPGPAQSSAQQLKDINTGISDSLPEDFAEFDGKVYFSADDGVNGSELWVSDGTASGTIMLKDINTGAGSSPGGFTVFDGKLYFAADDGVDGRELWVSDGTATGTTLFKNIHAGTNQGSSPSDLIVFDGQLYFAADDGVNGNELWSSDGTASGTVMAEDINPGSGHSNPSDLALADGQLYFQADGGTDGAEPWVLGASCSYPLDATLTQVAPWGPALISGAPTVDDLVDIMGTQSKILTFYPEGDSDGFQAMAMSSDMADTYPPSGELGDVSLPSSGVISYQININKIFDPANSSASSTGMEIIFASGNLTNNISVSVGNHFNAPGSRWAYIRMKENQSLVENIPLFVGTDIGETAKIGISIDRSNKKVYWSLDGGTPQAFQSGGTDHVYQYNGTHGFFMVNANTGNTDETGDPIVSDSNSSTLVTCAGEMDQQFPSGAEDISGNSI